jgi:hypothetical protein
MTRAPIRIALVAALACAALATCVTVVRADVESDYGRGWTAYKQGNWKLVVEAMRAAIAERPVEQGRINIGSNNNQPYLPHYYVGLALFRLGDCRGAIESWRKSLAQGYVRKFRQENEDFSKYFPICDNEISIEADLAAAQTTMTSLQTLAQDPLLAKVWSSEPELGPAVAEASQQVAGARREFDTARREREQQRVTALTAARTSSSDARRKLDTLEQGARARQQALAAEARAKQVPVTVAGNTAPSPLPGSTPPSPGYTPPLPPTKPVQALGPAPDQLRTGIQRFVSGQYREAIGALGAVQSGGRWHAQAALFRSAASFSLYRATGDARWRQTAQQAARECATLDPTLQADEQLLSPAFRRFFKETVQAAGASASR